MVPPMKTLGAGIAKKSGRIGRLIRYGLVGSVVAALYSGFTILLVQTGLISDPTLASAVSFAFTIPLSFLAHRAITYADAVRDGAEGRRFGIIAVSTFVVSTGTVKLVDLWGEPYWIALAVIWFLVPATNYIINAVWVFKVSGLFAVKPSEALSDRNGGM